jgi:hypothetical protein
MSTLTVNGGGPLLRVELKSEHESFGDFASAMDVVDEVGRAARLVFEIGPSQDLLVIAHEWSLVRDLEQRLRARSLDHDLRANREMDDVLRLELELAIDLARTRAHIGEKSLLLGVPMHVWEQPWRWRAPRDQWPNLWVQRLGRTPDSRRVAWQSTVRLVGTTMKSPLLLALEVGALTVPAAIPVAGLVLLPAFAAVAWGYAALRLMHMDREESRRQREAEVRAWLIEQLVTKTQSVDREEAAEAVEMLIQMLNPSVDRLKDRGFTASLPDGLPFLSSEKK